jgi:hypothetical protein
MQEKYHFSSTVGMEAAFQKAVPISLNSLKIFYLNPILSLATDSQKKISSETGFSPFKSSFFFYSTS